MTHAHAHAHAHAHPRTIHVAIGNTDDRLGQLDWHHFVRSVDNTVRTYGDPIYGAWVSPSSSPYQNAAWAFQVSDTDARDTLRDELVRLLGIYGQDSIAWNESRTEFLRANGSADPLFPPPPPPNTGERKADVE